MAALQGFKYGVRITARLLRATADRLDPPAPVVSPSYPRQPRTGGTYATGTQIDTNGFDWTVGR